ncbi:hypothetical protein [Sphingomicrobium clamense]|uniref:Lipoprotein n=1 Tax=Sphingomicrobium clamense TaxID=2851013 RepID=A0ABS6V4V1_9SPHN|nr:hypothetical protein [Sphingomicrobium sp. B8]MBW0144580.1 hypothetical protein [Sphingomicrobium sp. B8]
MRLAFASIPVLLLAACEDPPVEPVEAPTAPAEAVEAAPEAPLPGVEAFLREQLGDDLSDMPFRVVSGTADLDGDGSDEVLAYPMGPMTCGSGGCTLYVLSPAGTSYRILDEISVSRLPIYKLPAGADGWAELGITVGGGGMEGGVMAVPHDSAGYAGNPTVPPAYEIDPGDAQIIIDEPPLP